MGINTFEIKENNTVLATASLKIAEIKLANYYNERAFFLYKNYEGKQNKTVESRLIKQDEYNRISNKECNLSDTHFELNANSKIITSKIKGSDFKKMLDDSNLDSKDFSIHGVNRRMEQAALFLLDTENCEIRIEIQDDKKNYSEKSHMFNMTLSRKDNVAIWQPIGKILGDEKVIVIGTIHTHPINFLGEEGFGTTKTYPNFHGDDREASSEAQVPYYHLYPTGINEVDVIIPSFPNKNNICTTKELINGKFDIAFNSLEENGNLKSKTK